MRESIGENRVMKVVIWCTSCKEVQMDVGYGCRKCYRRKIDQRNKEANPEKYKLDNIQRDRNRRVRCTICGELTGKHIAGTICRKCWKQKVNEERKSEEELDTVRKQSRRNWHYANHNRSIQITTEWKKNNKDKVDQYNKEHILEKRHSVELRRARILDADDGTMSSPSDWRELIALYGNKCAYCLKKFDSADLEQDHVEPISKGGQHSMYNVVPACRPCNRHKASSYIEPRHYMWTVINGIHIDVKETS